MTLFAERVAIHHVFPRAWGIRQGMRAAVFSSIVSQTPRSAKTNRSVGGTAPSADLRKLCARTISREMCDNAAER